MTATSKERFVHPDYDIDPDLEDRTNVLLDEIFQITGEFIDVRSPCGFGHYDGSKPVPENLRHQCKIEHGLLPTPEADCREDIPKAVENHLRELAVHLTTLADLVRDHQWQEHAESTSTELLLQT